MTVEIGIGFKVLWIATQAEDIAAFEPDCLMNQTIDVSVASASEDSLTLAQQQPDVILLSIKDFIDCIHFLKKHKQSMINQIPIVVMGYQKWNTAKHNADLLLYQHGASYVLYQPADYAVIRDVLNHFSPLAMNQAVEFTSNTSVLPLKALIEIVAKNQSTGTLSLAMLRKQLHIRFYQGGIVSINDSRGTYESFEDCINKLSSALLWQKATVIFRTNNVQSTQHIHEALSLIDAAEVYAGAQKKLIKDYLVSDNIAQT